MIIKIDFYQKIDRSDLGGGFGRGGLGSRCRLPSPSPPNPPPDSEVREALLSAFDLLGDNETGGIFRDDYGLAIKDNPGQIILEVSSPTPYGLWSDDTDEYEKLFVWQDERWHEVE